MKWNFNLRWSETNVAKQKHISQQLSLKTFICVSTMFLTIFFDIFESKNYFKNAGNTFLKTKAWSDRNKKILQKCYFHFPPFLMILQSLTRIFSFLNFVMGILLFQKSCQLYPWLFKCKGKGEGLVTFMSLCKKC